MTNVLRVCTELGVEMAMKAVAFLFIVVCCVAGGRAAHRPCRDPTSELNQMYKVMFTSNVFYVACLSK